MGLLLLGETISGDTGITLGALLGILGLAGGAAVAAIISRVTHGLAIQQLRVDLKEQSDGAKIAVARLHDLESWRTATKAAEDALERHSSTTRGTKPYPRGPG